jgi:hypothetical protein
MIPSKKSEEKTSQIRGINRRMKTPKSTQFLLTQFLLTRFLSLLTKELIPQVTLELDGFLEVVGLWRKHRWSWGCV